jgi:hypothetical protein
VAAVPTVSQIQKNKKINKKDISSEVTIITLLRFGMSFLPNLKLQFEVTIFWVAKPFRRNISVLSSLLKVSQVRELQRNLLFLAWPALQP